VIRQRDAIGGVVADQSVALGVRQRRAQRHQVISDRGIRVPAAVLLGGIGEPADELSDMQRRHVDEPQPLPEVAMRRCVEQAPILDARALAEPVATVALIVVDPVAQVAAQGDLRPR
jgi:hypothetical protein